MYCILTKLCDNNSVCHESSCWHSGSLALFISLLGFQFVSTWLLKWALQSGILKSPSVTTVSYFRVSFDVAWFNAVPFVRLREVIQCVSRIWTSLTWLKFGMVIWFKARANFIYSRSLHLSESLVTVIGRV